MPRWTPDSSTLAEYYDQWLREQSSFPSAMIVHLDEPLRENSQVDATVFPSIDRRDVMGCYMHPRYRKGYEIGFCLVGGLLTRREAARLHTALSVVSHLHGFSAHESIAFIIHFFLMIVDYARWQVGRQSLLRGPRWGDADVSTEAGRKRIVNALNRPLYGIERLLDFWDNFGGEIAASRIFKSPDGSPGRPWYLSIPPLWFDSDKLARIGGVPVQPPKVPVLVDPSLASFTEQFAAFYEEYVRALGPRTLDFNASADRGPANRTLPTSRRVFPSVTLSDAEEHEFEANRFKSRLLIQVTGQTEGRKANVIFIDGLEVILPDAQFRLFLRLVVALHEVDDGYISLGTLRAGGGIADEGIAFPEEIHQAVSRLRLPLRPTLRDLKPGEFIQVRRKRIRLSTHRRHVLFNRDQLARHPDELIRSLALRLPTDSG